MSSTVQVGGWEIQSTDESAADMVKALKGPEEQKGPKVIQDRGKAPEKDERDPAAVALGKKGGEAAAKAREERAKEESKPAVDKAPDKPEAEKEAKPSPQNEEAVDKEADKPAPKPRHDLQARVQQLTSERRAMLAEIAELRSRVEAREERRPAPEPQERPETPQRGAAASEEPVLDQFETYEDWIRAHTKWEVRQEIAEERRKAEAARLTHERQAAAEKRHQSFRSKVSERLDEWSQVDHRLMQMMESAPPILELGPSDEVGPANYITEAITQSEDPTGFALYLSENEDLVRDLLNSSPWELPMKLGKLEARFVREEAREGRPAPKASAAPPPIRPLSTSAQADDDMTGDMSFDTFMRKKRRS